MKIKFFVVLLLTFSIGVGFYCYLRSFHPSDRKMEAFFLEHEKEFERLRAMFEEDENCSTIGNYGNTPIIDYTKPEPRAACEVSEQRQTEYREIFKKLNIRALIHRDYERHDVMFFSTSFRVVERNENGESIITEKGYAFALNRQLESVESLDGIKIDDTRFEQKKYRQLKENWYLYYEKGISKPE